MNRNSRIASFALMGFSLFACSCHEPKIGKILSPLPSSIEMTGEDDPDIEHFFNFNILAKREGDLLKWKLVLDPTNYNKTLSEELTKYEKTSSETAFRLDNNAILIIKFLDIDGFELERAKAGATTIYDLSNGNIPDKKSGSVPVLSKDDYRGEVCYYGDLQLESAKFDKIDKARIECTISTNLKNIFSAIINSEKEKRENRSESK